MKRKFLIFVVSLCLILPCAIMFAACDKGNKGANKTITSIELKYEETQGKYLNCEYAYGEDLAFAAANLKIIAKYSDGTSGELPDGQYALVTTEICNDDIWEEFEFAPNTHPNIGSYQIRVGFNGLYAYISLKITATEANSGIEVEADNNGVLYLKDAFVINQVAVVDDDLGAVVYYFYIQNDIPQATQYGAWYLKAKQNNEEKLSLIKTPQNYGNYGYLISYQIIDSEANENYFITEYVETPLNDWTYEYLFVPNDNSIEPLQILINMNSAEKFIINKIDLTE